MKTEAHRIDIVKEYSEWWEGMVESLPERDHTTNDSGTSLERCWVNKDGVKDYRHFARLAYDNACQRANQLELAVETPHQPRKLELEPPPSEDMTEMMARSWFEHYKQQLQDYQDNLVSARDCTSQGRSEGKLGQEANPETSQPVLSEWGERAPKKVTAECKVEEFLRDKKPGQVKIKDVEKATNYKKGTIGETRAWKFYSEQTKAKRDQERGIKERALTEEMNYAIPANDESTAIVDATDLVMRKLCELVSPVHRASLHKLSTAEQTKLLEELAALPPADNESSERNELLKTMAEQFLDNLRDQQAPMRPAKRPV